MARQQRAIIAPDTRNGGSIMAKNSGSRTSYFAYRYRFCGLPNGVSIPPRLAEKFCMIKRNARSRPRSAESRIIAPSGRKVSSAMSLTMNMELKKVIAHSARQQLRAVEKRATSFRARTPKKPTLFSAFITASTENRQASVLKSGYFRYPASGFTQIAVTAAAHSETSSTAFFDRNFPALCKKTAAHGGVR